MTSTTEFIDEPDTLRNEVVDNGLLVTGNRTTELREKLTERGVDGFDESNGYADVTTFITNGIKWTVISKSYLNPEHDWMTLRAEHITPEQVIAATLEGGMLTAEQVREVIYKNSTYNDIYKLYQVSYADIQRITDELNVEMGNGTCEQVLVDCNDGLMPPGTAYCSACGAEGGFTPKFCYECGTRVVRTRDERSIRGRW